MYSGELAQMVERPLRMREVPGSIPGFSKIKIFGIHHFLSFLSFSFLFAGICFSFICYKMPVVCHDFQHRTTVFQSLCYLLEQWSYNTGYLSVHSLSPSAEEAYISWCTFKLRTFNFTLYVKFSDTLNLAQLGPWFAWRKWSCCCRFQ